MRDVAHLYKKNQQRNVTTTLFLIKDKIFLELALTWLVRVGLPSVLPVVEFSSELALMIRAP